MAEMTDEEAWKLAELFEKNPPAVSKIENGGFFMKRKEVVDKLGVDGIVADYLASKMFSTKQPLSAIIRNLVKKELAIA